MQTDATLFANNSQHWKNERWWILSSVTGFESMTSQTPGGRSIHLSYGELMESEAIDTRPAYCKDQQGRCRPRPYTVCDVINFSAQRQLLEEQEIFQIMPRFQVNLFLQIWKFLMFLVSTPSKLVLSCTYIIMMLSLFLLLKSFKLEIRLINIQPDTLTFTDLRPVEQILQKFRSGLKVLEYGIHYRTTSKTLRLLIYSSVWSNHF